MADSECVLSYLHPLQYFLTLIYSGYFAQHHLDLLDPSMSPVQFLASKFPGKNEQEYRSHLGNFQISGMTGYNHLSQSNDK